MARPLKEGGPTPAKVRQAKSLQNLRDAGGDKVCAWLPAEIFAAFKRCQQHLGAPATATATVIAAIEALDAKLARAARRDGAAAPTGSFGMPMDQVVLARNAEGRTVIRRRKP